MNSYRSISHSSFGCAYNYSFLLQDFHCAAQDSHSIAGGSDGPPFATKFNPFPGYHDLIAVGNEDGFVSLYHTHYGGPESVRSCQQVHANAIFDLEWLTNSAILTASGDKTVSLWDTEAHKVVETYEGHTGSVKSVNKLNGSEHLFATAARDGDIMVWDRRISTRRGKLPAVNTINNAHSVARGKWSRPHDGVTSLVFSDERRLASSGAADGTIKVWDLRMSYRGPTSRRIPPFEFPYAGTSALPGGRGISHLASDTDGAWLFASCLDDVVYQFHLTSCAATPIACFVGHRCDTFHVKASVSADGRYLVSGSTCGSAFVSQIARPDKPPVALEGHSDEVNTVQWHPSDSSCLVTGADDSLVKVWRIDRRFRDNKENNGGELRGSARLRTDINPREILLSKEMKSSLAAAPWGSRNKRVSTVSNSALIYSRGCQASSTSPSLTRTIGWPAIKHSSFVPQFHSPKRLIIVTSPRRVGSRNVVTSSIKTELAGVDRRMETRSTGGYNPCTPSSSSSSSAKRKLSDTFALSASATNVERSQRFVGSCHGSSELTERALPFLGSPTGTSSRLPESVRSPAQHAAIKKQILLQQKLLGLSASRNGLIERSLNEDSEEEFDDDVHENGDSSSQLQSVDSLPFVTPSAPKRRKTSASSTVNNGTPSTVTFNIPSVTGNSTPSVRLSGSSLATTPTVHHPTSLPLSPLYPVFTTPTSDLPNYILNARPRNPVTPTQRKQRPDWLTDERTRLRSATPDGHTTIVPSKAGLRRQSKKGGGTGGGGGSSSKKSSSKTSRPSSPSASSQQTLILRYVLPAGSRPKHVVGSDNPPLPDISG